MMYNLVPKNIELASLLCVCTNNKIAELADRYRELKFIRSAPLPKVGTEEEQNLLLSRPPYLGPLETPLFVLLHLHWPFLSNRLFSSTQDKQLAKQMVLYSGLEVPMSTGFSPGDVSSRPFHDAKVLLEERTCPTRSGCLAERWILVSIYNIQYWWRK